MSMARYEIHASRLAAAEENLLSLADRLRFLSERIDGIQFELPDDPHLVQKKKQISCSVKDICLSVKNIGRTLTEITAVYANAERCAFGDDDVTGRRVQTDMKILRQPSVVRQSGNVLLFGDLIMPDWLQAAVIKFEQSQ